MDRTAWNLRLPHLRLCGEGGRGFLKDALSQFCVDCFCSYLSPAIPLWPSFNLYVSLPALKSFPDRNCLSRCCSSYHQPLEEPSRTLRFELVSPLHWGSRYLLIWMRAMYLDFKNISRFNIQPSLKTFRYLVFQSGGLAPGP